MADALSRRLEAGEALELRQPPGPLVAGLLFVGLSALLCWWPLAEGLNLRPWTAGLALALGAPFAWALLRRFRSGGMVVTASGLRRRGSGQEVPWREVTDLGFDARSLIVVTSRGTFTLDGVASPEPLGMVLLRRVQQASPLPISSAGQIARDGTTEITENTETWKRTR
jgi:hypothetical protein